MVVRRKQVDSLNLRQLFAKTRVAISYKQGTNISSVSCDPIVEAALIRVGEREVGRLAVQRYECIIRSFNRTADTI